MKKVLATLALLVGMTGASFAQTAAQSNVGFLLAQGSTYGSYTCPSTATSPCFVQYGSAVPVSGTVTVTPAPIPDATQATGNITNNGDAVTLTTTGGYTTVGISVSGTWSGTLQVSASQDCTTYSVTTSLPLSSGIPSAVISANGAYQANFAGLKCFKVTGLSMVSGTAAIKISAGVGTGPVMQDNTPWVIGGYTTGASSTGSAATVKAASTAAASTDTSLVVGLNPLSNAVTLTPSATVGLTTSSCTAACASTLVSGAHTLYGGSFSATVTGWLLIYDATTCSANGTVTPKKAVAYTAANQTVGFSWADSPLVQSTGIAACFSTTGPYTATASTTAFVSVDYK